MNIKMLKAAIAGLVLAISSFANAGLITDILDVEVISGPGTGVLGTITVEYDDSLITGQGLEELWNPDFNLTLNLFGQIFTNSDDIDLPLFPMLRFNNGDINFINYVISEITGTNLTNINDPSIQHISGGEVTAGIPDQSLATWKVDTQGVDVPEPSTLAIFALGIMGLASRRFKKQ